MTETPPTIELGDVELEPEQAQAITDFVDNEQNVSLMAGAGTGKTTTMTAGYVHILDRALPEIDDPEDAATLPEQILTTTFTERAAENLTKKVREAIGDRLTEIDDDETYAKWRAVSDALESGYVHTLHGFCNRLLQERALEASDIAPGFETLEEGDAAALAEEVAAATVETHDGEWFVDVLATRFARRTVVSIVAELLEDRADAKSWVETMRGMSEEKYRAMLIDRHPLDPATVGRQLSAAEDALRAIVRFADEPPASIDTSKQTWDSMILPLATAIGEAGGPEITDCSQIEQLVLYEEICDCLTAGNGDLYEGSQRWRAIGPSAWQKTTSEAYQGYCDAISTLETRFEPETVDVDGDIRADLNNYQYLQALAEVTHRALEELATRKREQNQIDFTDQIEFAVQYLDEASSATRHELREQFKYVMVDEFQDTNTRQWELIQQLVADVEAFDAQNVFIVGDIKQSIYRFRDADVTTFGEATDALEAANAPHHTPTDEHQLIRNFRTLPAPLKAINGLFHRVFDTDPESFEAPPQPLAPDRESNDRQTPVTEYMPVPRGEPEFRESLLGADHGLVHHRETSTGELEARAVAARLAGVLNSETYVEPDDDESEAATDESRIRNTEPGDIAILLRARTHLKDYERALREAEIPYTVIKGEGFFETPEIRHLMNLLRVLVDPTENRFLYAALRSPLFGMSDEALAHLAAQRTSDDTLWDALCASENSDHQQTVTAIERWRTAAGTDTDADGAQVESWGALLTEILDETGYLTTIAADERGYQAIPNVDKFRNRLWGLSDDGVGTLADALQRLERQAEQETHDPEASDTGETDSVQIMTIYEAKGEEFPVVVVPGIGCQFNMQAAVANGKVEFERDGDGEDNDVLLGLKGPDPDEPFEETETILRAAAKSRRKRELRAEEKRVLYVACTRARDHLLLSGSHTVAPDDDDRSDWEVPVAPPADEGDATRWSDWVEPALFGTEGDAHDRWHQLRDTGSVTRGLEYQRQNAEGGWESEVGQLEIRLPPALQTYEDDGTGARDDESTAVCTTISDAPPLPATRAILSPSDCTDIAAGTKRLEPTDDRRLIPVAVDDRDHEGADESDTAESKHTSMPADVRGEIVHRLCELRPPRDEWSTVVSQVIAEARAQDRTVPTPSAAGREAVFEHAERALAYRESLHEGIPVVAAYDEYPIETELTTEDGLDIELFGYIDHLVVTDDAFHVVDYKTDSFERYLTTTENETVSGFLDERSTHHEPQLMAYAAGLSSMDPARETHIHLYFTDPDVAQSWDAEPELTKDAEASLRSIFDEESNGT